MKTLFLTISIFVLNTFLCFSQDWQKDITLAKKIASKKNNPIVLVFQGSDWCAPCKKLEIEIWSTQEFKNYASNHFVMLKADFPKRKKNAISKEQQEKNNKLAEIYNSKGYFPFVVVLDKSGKVLGQTSYRKMRPKEYIKLLESFIE